jgi:PadR family transcriptional regulator PadR
MPRRRDSSPQTLRLLDAMLGEPDRWWYGYELHRRLGLPSGTLYPILIRLAERGLLEARWEPPARPGRPPRHLYRVTAEGALARRREPLAVKVASRSRLAAPEPG